MTCNQVYVNGEYFSLDEAQISVRDLGFLRGYGVFDVMPIVNGKAFLHKKHWERLEKSAWDLRLHIPIAREDHRIIIEKLTTDCGKESGLVVRTILTGGFSANGFLPENKETFCVLVEDAHPLPVQVYEKGVHVETVEYRRAFPSIKTTDYITPIRYRKKHPEKKEILEIIYVWAGRVLEASTSNVVIVKGKNLYAPYDDVLEGITRLFVLRLAHQMGMEVIMQDMATAELMEADEVFLTASNKGVVPVVVVDGSPIGNGEPGNITKQLMEAYNDALRKY